MIDMSPLWISLKTAGVATVITFFAGIAIARGMAQYKGRLKGLVDGILTLPLVLPPTVIGFFLLLLFGRNGPLGKLLLRLGTSIIFSWSATVITATIVSLPLMYKTSRGAFEQIDQNLVNAARTLGSSEWRIFWRLQVPLAWPGIAAGGILAFTRALGEFGATLMLAGNIPGKTQTIPLAIYFAAQSGNMAKVMLWVVLVSALSLSVILAMNLWLDKQQKYYRG